MNAQEEAGAIFAHYFEQLARRVGVRWNDRNRADIAHAAALLAQAGDVDADTIPPYEPPAPHQIESRVTQNLEIDDPAFQRWRGRRAVEDDRTIVQRMTTRER